VALLFLPFAFCLLSFAFSEPRASANHFAPQLMVNIEKGRVLYAGSCGNSYCHGSEGKGGGGPKLINKSYRAAYLKRVIGNGIEGTTMPPFKSRFSDMELSQLTAYVLSLSPNGDNPAAAFAPPPAAPQGGDFATAHGASGETKPATNAAATMPSAPSAPSNFTVDLRGDASSGRELFFDSTVVATCRSCHTVNGIGGKVASDLTKLRALPPRDILQRLLAPQNSKEERYGLLAVTMKDGTTYTGIKRDEVEKELRLFDTSSLPPISRTLPKSDIAKTEKKAGTACPGNYAEKYSLKQLLDLIAFFKTEDLRKPATVSLREVF
jgi:putative heme-binding domain-containing protein